MKRVSVNREERIGIDFWGFFSIKKFEIRWGLVKGNEEEWFSEVERKLLDCSVLGDKWKKCDYEKGLISDVKCFG